MSSSVMGRRAALAVLGASACAGPVPSQTPLAPGAARASGHTLRDSSRVQTAGESNEATENQDGGETIEIDDDGDGDGERVSSSTWQERAACDFASAPQPDCSVLARVASGRCVDSIAVRACETWGRVLDARVSQKWLSCLSDTSAGGAACDGERTLKCAMAAIDAACVDDRFRSTCDHIAAVCADSVPEITRRFCEHALSAFEPRERDKIAQCLEHGCDTGAFGGCIP